MAGTGQITIDKTCREGDFMCGWSARLHVHAPLFRRDGIGYWGQARSMALYKHFFLKNEKVSTWDGRRRRPSDEGVSDSNSILFTAVMLGNTLRRS